MSVRNALFACFTLSALAGCSSLPEYNPSREISPVDYAEELVLQAAQPNKKQPYGIRATPVHTFHSGYQDGSSLGTGSLIALNSPMVIGQRMVSLCNGTGGTLIPPSNRPAVENGSGFRSVIYGCKRTGKPDFAFAIINVRNAANSISFLYDFFVWEAVPHYQAEFEQRTREFDIAGF